MTVGMFLYCCLAWLYYLIFIEWAIMDAADALPWQFYCCCCFRVPHNHYILRKNRGDPNVSFCRRGFCTQRVPYTTIYSPSTCRPARSLHNVAWSVHIFSQHVFLPSDQMISTVHIIIVKIVSGPLEED